MASDVYSFFWPVPKAGYEWIQAKIQPGYDPTAEQTPQWVLTPVGIVQTMQPYSPLKEFSGLYRTFSQLPPEDRDAILAFANKYGDFGYSKQLVLPPKIEPGQKVYYHGETLSDWSLAIDAMHTAVVIWDMVMKGDRAGLSQRIRWQEAEYEEVGTGGGRPEGWIYDTHPDLPVGTGPVHRRLEFIRPVLDLFKPGDVLTPAAFLVQRWVSERLERRISPQLLYDVDRGKRVIQIVPNTLLDAMWLQFARAIEGDKEYRACKECGRWFEISDRQADRRTKRREFCSDPCKSRDYRKRKDRAAKEAAAKSAPPKKRHPGKKR
jgi:hypothetical protein